MTAKEFNENELLFNELYEKTKDCGRTQFVKLLMEKERENEQLKKQLKYIRIGEYYNQLRFERDMLQNIVDNGEVSKEDREFIDCTHRNTELLKDKQELIEYLKECILFEKNNGAWASNAILDVYEEILSKFEKR